MQILLEKIRDFADRAHGSQMRKYTPERYIVHPVRVMETVRKHDDRLPVLAAALLHDVLEDTLVTREEMHDFLRTVFAAEDADWTLGLVVELTDVYVKEAYPTLNRKSRKALELQRIAGTSAASQTIKYADILDNTSEIAAHDPDFAPRFLSECRANLEIARKGNRELWQMAWDRVNDELQHTGPSRGVRHRSRPPQRKSL